MKTHSVVLAASALALSAVGFIAAPAIAGTPHHSDTVISTHSYHHVTVTVESDSHSVSECIYPQNPVRGDIEYCTSIDIRTGNASYSKYKY